MGEFFKISNLSALPTPSYFHLELSFHFSNIHPTFNYFQQIQIFYLPYFQRNLKGNFSGFQILQNFQSFSFSYSFILSLRTVIPLLKHSSNHQLLPADSDFFYLPYFQRNLKGNFSGFQILQNFQSFSFSYSFILSLRTVIPLLKHSSNHQLLPADSDFFYLPYFQRNLKGNFNDFQIFQIFQYLKTTSTSLHIETSNQIHSVHLGVYLKLC
ncbi:hypothetical protein LDENG_00265720 [Lucifuga dentata]|nr:hypothetical protein LDENG_00265720 [Lucifuga dentata]